MRRYIFLFLLQLVLLTGCGVPDRFKFEGEFGKRGTKPGEFSNPLDIDITPDDDIVVADAGNHRLQVLSPDGTFKMTVGEYGTTGFKIQGIAGCGVSKSSGEILLCDIKGNKIVKYDKTGTPKQKIVDKMKPPLDAAFDKFGNVFVVMAGQAALSKYDPVGKFLGNIGGSGKAAFALPSAVYIRNEKIYVADSGARRVVKMTLTGEFEDQFSSKGEFEEMKSPSGIYVDNLDNIFIIDGGEVPLVQLLPDGKFFSKIGGFGDSPGNFMYPKGIVVRENGEILVLDNNRSLVVKYKKGS